MSGTGFDQLSVRRHAGKLMPVESMVRWLIEHDDVSRATALELLTHATVRHFNGERELITMSTATDPRDRIPELAQDIDRLRELYRNLSVRQENTTPSLLSVFAAMLTAIAQAEEALSAIVLENSSDDEPAADDEPADNVI